MDAVEFLKLASGNLDPMQAYFKGRIELAGDIMVAAKLAQMFKMPGGGNGGGASDYDDAPRTAAGTVQRDSACDAPARGRPDDSVLAPAHKLSGRVPILDRMGRPPPRRRSNCAPSSSGSVS